MCMIDATFCCILSFVMFLHANSFTISQKVTTAICYMCLQNVCVQNEIYPLVDLQEIITLNSVLKRTFSVLFIKTSQDRSWQIQNTTSVLNCCSFKMFSPFTERCFYHHQLLTPEHKSMNRMRSLSHYNMTNAFTPGLRI